MCSVLPGLKNDAFIKTQILYMRQIMEMAEGAAVTRGGLVQTPPSTASIVNLSKKWAHDIIWCFRRCAHNNVNIVYCRLFYSHFCTHNGSVNDATVPAGRSWVQYSRRAVPLRYPTGRVTEQITGAVWIRGLATVFCFSLFFSVFHREYWDWRPTRKYLLPDPYLFATRTHFSSWFYT